MKRPVIKKDVALAMVRFVSATKKANQAMVNFLRAYNRPEEEMRDGKSISSISG